MVELTKENFDARVTNAEGTVLVDFWSPGCGPCRAMEPVLEAVAARHPEVRFAKLNAAEHPDIAWAFKVVSVPTLVLFRDRGARRRHRRRGTRPAHRGSSG